MLRRKDSNNENIIRNFNFDQGTSIKDGLMGKAQTRTIPDGSIQSNLRLICFTIDRVNKLLDKGGALT